MTTRILVPDPWWHDMAPEAVVERAKGLPLHEQQALISEVKAACAGMSKRAQDTTLDQESRRRAYSALMWTVKKKRLLAALAGRNHAEGFDHKRERVETMLETAEECEDPKEAIRLLAATMRAMWGLE